MHTIPETITWHDATQRLPDDDVTCLLWIDYGRNERDWCAGWRDGDVWRDAGSAFVISGTVTHWAEPSGPDDMDMLRAEIVRLRVGNEHIAAGLVAVEADRDMLRDALAALFDAVLTLPQDATLIWHALEDAEQALEQAGGPNVELTGPRRR